MNNLEYNIFEMGNLILLIFFFSIFFMILKNLFKNEKKNKKSIILNCGIWAWSGKDSSDFNKSKFDILGIFNDSRGGDGSGIFKNNEIIKQCTPKTYKQFITDKNYNNDLEHPLIIGHTRNSSKGLKSSENNHPFGFPDNKKDDYEFVGVHNGTLYNEDELAELYKVDNSKIDSHILLESIYKSKSFKVLEHYIGAAALVFVNLKEPNTIYAFRGESKVSSYSTDTKEERPLYFYQESKNSLYISSLMISLMAITEKEDDVKNIEEFKANTVYKITNGNIEKSTRYKINRKECFQRIYNNNYGTGNLWKGESSRQKNLNLNSRSLLESKEEIFKHKQKNKDSNKKKSSDIFNIHEETMSNKERKGGKILFENFLFKRNGHEVSGIFLNDLYEGLLFLGDTHEEALKNYKNNYLGRYYDYMGEKYLKQPEINGYEKNDNRLFIPYPKEDFNKKTVPFVYFIEGIRVFTALDYENTRNNHQLMKDSMQFCTFYPMLINDKAYHKGKKVALARFCPLNSRYVYTIVAGEVVSRRDIKTTNLLSSINSKINFITADMKFSNVSDIFSKNKSSEITLKETDDDLTTDYNFHQNLIELEEDDEITTEPKVFNLPIPKSNIKEDDINNKSLNDLMFGYNKIKTFQRNYLQKKIDSLNRIRFTNSEYLNKKRKILKVLNTFVEDFEKFEKEITV